MLSNSRHVFSRLNSMVKSKAVNLGTVTLESDIAPLDTTPSKLGSTSGPYKGIISFEITYTGDGLKLAHELLGDTHG